MNDTNKPQTKTRGIAADKLVIAFLSHRKVGDVEAIYDKGNCSKGTVRTAIKVLEKDHGVDVTQLREWYDAKMGRAPVAPRPGESRSYKAQLSKRSPTCFLRLVLPGIKKGDSVIVTHGSVPGSVTVSPATSNTPPAQADDKGEAA